MDDQLESGRDQAHDRIPGQMYFHQDHQSQPFQHLQGRIGMPGRHGAWVARVHGLEHGKNFSAANFPHQNPVWTHAQSRLD